VIEKISVRVFQVSAPTVRFGYEPRFQLRETSGNSGATIAQLAISASNTTEFTGPACWRDALRVPPGGTLDTFYSDAGTQWLSYCGAGGSGPTQTPTVVIKVTFTDDNGQLATAEATVDLSKQP
jgi:hypothetical protein